ncbi:MAG: glycosyltransferase [Puniceicoccaceae bacterium]
MQFFGDHLLLLYFFCSLGLLIYGLNSYILIFFFLRRREESEENSRVLHKKYLARDLDDPIWPVVTTQIAIYNEYNVAERIIRAVAAMEYPRERHEIQVLDDSNDETVTIVDEVVSELEQNGYDIKVLRRTNRWGYKAGALAEGLAASRGELIAIFDSDFVPGVTFLREMVPHLLEDPEAGLVQARWGHLNARESMLTLAQAMGIDGHFIVEQSARSWGRLFLNFNGTAGLWRRQAIEDAGGWEADTLTEDMDLSYRAQLAGWRIRYDPGVVVPAELPDTYTAFKAQQFRWAKGSIQTAIKILPRVVASDFSLLAKVQAFFHLTHYAVHLMILLMSLLAWPVLLSGVADLSPSFYMVLGGLILAAFLGPNTLYLLAQWWVDRRGWAKKLLLLPLLMCLGLGVAVSNARAVLEALIGVKSAFIRTPKAGDVEKKVYRSRRTWVPWAEIGLGIYSGVTLFFYLEAGAWLIGPFLALYTTGYLAVGLSSLFESLRG